MANRTALTVTWEQEKPIQISSANRRRLTNFKIHLPLLIGAVGSIGIFIWVLTHGGRVDNAWIVLFLLGTTVVSNIIKKKNGDGDDALIINSAAATARHETPITVFLPDDHPLMKFYSDRLYQEINGEAFGLLYDVPVGERPVLKITRAARRGAHGHGVSERRQS